MSFVDSNIQDELPALIVSVNSSDDSVNLQVFIDGNIKPFWRQNVKKGSNSGEWNWPVIKK